MSTELQDLPIPHVEQALPTIAVYRVMASGRCMWLASARAVPVLSSLPLPADVLCQPDIALETLYVGQDRSAASTILKLAGQACAPEYTAETVDHEQSRLILRDKRVVSLFALSLETDTSLEVWKARIYARSTRMKLVHLRQYCELHGLVVERLSKSSIRITAASRWTLTLVNRADHCLWRADLTAMGLRWKSLDRLRGWSGKDARQHMIGLYNRLIGDQVREYCEPTRRVQRSPTFRKWVKNIPIPQTSLRPTMLRAQGWNPSIPYANWRKALSMGTPRIQWLT